MTLEDLAAAGPNRLDETSAVERWRLFVLVEAGYPVEVAEQLAARPWTEVDLHQAVDLIAAGCPHDLAASILI